MGTLNVASEVDGVTIKGDGEMHMTLSSSLLPNLNRQLQFVTYTNTLFHPSTADTVQFETEGHRAIFTIKIRHGVTPKLYDRGSKGGKTQHQYVSSVHNQSQTSCHFINLEHFEKLFDLKR
uniref:beta-1,4 N-acetylgalactosaminyltransferase 1-like n=1 Tax=Monopterus albus TaxID=43700 RepID=UPI0009B358D6|nr:beta-1,4 N-acetylgalactosaminyltransferase 1-like [Monopterus albus]